MKRPVLVSLLFAPLCLASSFTIPVVSVQGLPGQTVGFGVSLQNTSAAAWLVPMGLSNSGLLNGAFVDIFPYTPVAPLASSSVSYAFTAPGGYPFSQGLYEYTIPLSATLGTVESALVVMQYQLFDANPDLNPLAMPVSALLAFDGVAVQILVRDAAVLAVPEPALAWVAGALAFALCRRARERQGEPS